MTHSPGPWRFWPFDDRQPKGKGPYLSLVCPREGSNNGASRLVLAPNWLAGKPNEVWLSVEDDDARLIAAAPDLLEACKAAQDALTEVYDFIEGKGELSFGPSGVRLQLEQAIAKAEGAGDE